MRAPRIAAWLVGLAACGGAPAAPVEPMSALPPAARETRTPDRTPIEQRRDTACAALGPRLTACAVEDAKADLSAGKITQDQFQRDTAPEVQHKNTEQFLDGCKRSAYSSRQVRVLEVCPRAESRCQPLIDCLGHLNDPK